MDNEKEFLADDDPRRGDHVVILRNKDSGLIGLGICAQDGEILQFVIMDLEMANCFGERFSQLYNDELYAARKEQ